MHYLLMFPAVPVSTTAESPYQNSLVGNFLLLVLICLLTH